ncbi:MAG: dihydroxy-acid dehydratase [Candidatus Dormibacteraeota bacterium]|nr:dihydroxy-acid dehydratase [Candidatus Dormibacteraeota bacterium]
MAWLGSTRPSSVLSRRARRGAGGLAVLGASLQELGLLHEGCATVDGRTIGEIAAAAHETPGQEVIRPVTEALKNRGGIAILHGARPPDRHRGDRGRAR